MTWKDLEHLARQQGDVFTRAEAFQVAGRREFERSAAQGAWYPVFRGVYSISPPDTLVRAHAARLYFGRRRAIVAYATAAKLHGLDAPDDGLTHVLVSRDTTCAEPRIAAHRDVPPRTWRMLRHTGLLLTTAATAAVDTARTVEYTDAYRVLRSAIDLNRDSGGRRGASAEELCHEIEASTRRPGVRQAARAMEVADPTWSLLARRYGGAAELGGAA